MNNAIFTLAAMLVASVVIPNILEEPLQEITTSVNQISDPNYLTNAIHKSARGY